MHFNAESVLQELNDFGESDQDVSPVLEEYLTKIAKTGNIVFPWNKLKPLLKRKIDLVIGEFAKSCPPESIPALPNTDAFDYEKMRNSILDALDSFQNAPFTIQRLCELVTNPKKHYNRTDKYMRGLEKNLLVVSTVETPHAENDPAQNRNQPAMVNGGISTSGDSSGEEAAFDTASSTSTLPPAPVNGTVLENFATVFPSANRLANPSNNIQVTIVTENDTYQSMEQAPGYDYDSAASGCDATENDNFQDVATTSLNESVPGTSAAFEESSNSSECTPTESDNQAMQVCVVETTEGSSTENAENQESNSSSESAAPSDDIQKLEDDCGEPELKRMKFVSNDNDDANNNNVANSEGVLQTEPPVEQQDAEQKTVEPEQSSESSATGSVAEECKKFDTAEQSLEENNCDPISSTSEQ